MYINIRKFIIAVVVTFGAAMVGMLFSPDPQWYEALEKPPLQPPNWSFSVVWPILYLLMAIAAYLIWKGPAEKKKHIALLAFLIQLFLNAAWSPLFFGMQEIFLALVDISLLWVAIIVTIILFARIDKLAALLLIPYILWVSFAVYLNAAIWVLNR